jgi:hypothetical protein
MRNMDRKFIDFLLLGKNEKHGIPIFFDILLLGME